MSTLQDSFLTIDVGVNFSSRYSDAKINEILEESKSCVDKIVTISNSIKEIRRNQQISQQHPCMYFTVGVHPHNAKSITNLTELDVLKTYVNDSKCVAIGECGLDYDRMFSPKVKQLEVFERQILIAKESKMPLYLHCRGDAYDDFFTMLSKHGYYNGVVHCFTGNRDQARKICQLGFHIGITGFLLDSRRNRDLVEALRHIPLERLLVETDAPFLSIDRKRDSHPMDTGDIVYEIARIKKVDPIKCGQQIYNNTLSVFNLHKQL